MTDAVNHPPHYTRGKVECIDALQAATADLVGIEAVCTANAIKYLWRWKLKGGVEDLRKARWYVERLIGESSTARIAELEGLVASLSERCHKQSELLSKRAEKPTGEIQ